MTSTVYTPAQLDWGPWPGQCISTTKSPIPGQLLVLGYAMYCEARATCYRDANESATKNRLRQYAPMDYNTSASTTCRTGMLAGETIRAQSSPVAHAFNFTFQEDPKPTTLNINGAQTLVQFESRLSGMIMLSELIWMHLRRRPLQQYLCPVSACLASTRNAH
jgi:hypothetical protein